MVDILDPKTQKQAKIPFLNIEIDVEDAKKIEFLQKEIEKRKFLLMNKEKETNSPKPREESPQTPEKTTKRRQTIQNPYIKKIFGINQDDVSQIMIQQNETLQQTISEKNSTIQKLEQKILDHQKIAEDLQLQNLQLSKKLKSAMEGRNEEISEPSPVGRPKSMKIDDNLKVSEFDTTSPNRENRKSLPKKYPLHIFSEDAKRWRDSQSLDLRKTPFEKYMENPEILKKYQAMLKKEACEESLMFFLKVKEFKANFNTCNNNLQAAKDVYDSFLKQNSPYEININQNLKDDVLKKIQKKEIFSDTFFYCYTHVISTMTSDSFMRFKMSKDAKDFQLQ